MLSLPSLRRPALPQRHAPERREAFLHLALLGMTLTVAALLAYIAERDADDAGIFIGER